MGGINSTKENVAQAIKGETHEFKVMYPEFLEVAAQEGANQASWSFNIANEVEKIHAEFYEQAAKALEAGGDMKAVDYYVCKVCGNTVEGEPTEKCPICNASAKAFFKVE
jgi:rubrerythrin